jgi:hypothetical protein
MNPVTDTHRPTRPVHDRRAAERVRMPRSPLLTGPGERSGSLDMDRVVVRLAGPADQTALSELQSRAGSASRPEGALMVAASDGRLLAAVSMSNRQSLCEPSPAGADAVAAVQLTISELARRSVVRARRRGVGRKRGTPS